MRNAFQVWHRDGDTFRKVAEVLAGSVLEAVELTQNIDSPDDPHEGQRWLDHASVTVVFEPFARSTAAGDVILTLEGAEFVVTAGDGGNRFGVQPIDAIREQAYAEWLAEEMPMSEAETERLFHEWRDDLSQRELTGKGADYSDVPYQMPTGQSYAEQRAAAASAKFHRPPGLEAPEL